MSSSSVMNLESGQVWTYRDAVHVGSRATIGRIDAEGDDAVISVAIGDRVSAAEPAVPAAIGIAHLPIRREALLRSLLEHCGHEDLPPHFDEGYRHWRNLYEEGRAGAFDIDLARAVEFVLDVKQTGARRSP